MRNSLSMTCGRARRLAFEPTRGQVTEIERWLAARHVAGCLSCRAFEADMHLLATRVPLVGAGEGPSPEFVSRLRRATASAGRGARYRRVAAVAAVAAAIAGLGVLAALQLSPDTRDPLLVELAARRLALLAEPGIESADPGAVEQWIVGRTGLHVHVPTFDDARLLGATATRIGGYPAAVVRFQVGTGYVAYATVAVAEAAEPDVTLRSASMQGLQLVWWHDRTSRHVWSGSVPADHLASFARRCIEQAAVVETLETAAADGRQPLPDHGRGRGV